MNEVPTEQPTLPFEGRMFLYKQPELLNRADHGDLGLSQVARPFDFVRGVNAVPLVSLEFSSAQKDFPIVFTDSEIPSPLGVLGVIDDVNLFVDDSGNWDTGHYIPSYIRCHPITFAAGTDDQLAVVIDRASKAISSQPDTPFFDGDGLSATMQNRVDYCASYNTERRRTRALCERLKELDLFTGQQIAHRPQGGGEERAVGTYLAVDREKLGSLSNDVIAALHNEGSLSALYAHIFSLENWARLLDRRARRSRSGNGERAAQ